MKALICVLLLAAVFCNAQEPMVAFGTLAEGGTIAVAQNGDWYFGGETGHVLSWSPRGNVFADAGFVQQANMAGVASHYFSTPQPQAIDELGNIFLLELTHHTWSYVGRLGELAGHEPSGSIIGMTSINFGTVLVVVTDAGDSYMHEQLGEWTYQGNVFVESGVIQEETQSLGSVKQLFR